MPITSQLLLQKDEKVQKIYATRPAGVNRQQVKETLADLARRGRITNRDERLFECLRELNVLSLNQIWRLFWPQAKEITAYNRLYFLMKQQLLSGARVPTAEMREWGLPVRKVYALGLGGWLWLKEEVSRTISTRHLRREQVLHDLLVAELYVRLAEAVQQRGSAWSITWAGELAAGFYGQGDTPIIAPDGLAIIRQQRGQKLAALPAFIEFDKGREAHGRPSSDWGRKVHGYNRFQAGNWKMHPQLHDSPSFPWVAVITHGPQRLLNLAQAIKKHRQAPIIYYLALWQDLRDSADILTAPAWLIVTPEGQVAGRERDQRYPLLPQTDESDPGSDGQTQENPGDDPMN
jgi:hypothetical protein